MGVISSGRQTKPMMGNLMLSHYVQTSSFKAIRSPFEIIKIF